MNQHLRQVHGKDKPNNEHEMKLETISVSERNAESSSEFQYICQDCGRRFRLKCTLTAHRTIHSNERPWECWLCHRSFKRRKLLKVHTRTHTEYAAIGCDICGKRFRRNIQRDNHIKERHNAPVPKRVKKPPPPPRARKLLDDDWNMREMA